MPNISDASSSFAVVPPLTASSCYERVEVHDAGTGRMIVEKGRLRLRFWKAQANHNDRNSGQAEMQ
jgi:hypothetical protein